MTFNITFIINNETHHAIGYGRNAVEAERRVIRQVVRSFGCSEQDVRIDKTVRSKVKK